MKKGLFIFLLAMALCLSACTPSENAATEAGTVAATQSGATDSTVGSQTEADTISQLPLPKETTSLAFSSGAAGWYSLIKLNRDGTFTGQYSDWDAGVNYTCSYSGKFVDFKKVNDYTYQMTLTDLTTEKTVGTEWTEDEIHYIASQPQGLVDPLTGEVCTEFVLYLPDAPVAQLNSDFTSWSPCVDRYSASNATLDNYAIWNVATNDGFYDGFFNSN